MTLAPSAGDRRLQVLHSAMEWLPLTQSWLYTQIRALPQDVRWSVACEWRTNRLRFPLGRVHPRLASSAEADAEEWDAALRRRTAFVVKRLEDSRAAVVHSHFGNLGWRDRKALAVRPAAQVVSFYGHDVVRLPQQQPKWRERYRELFAGADRFLVEGPFMAKTLVGQGAPAARVQVHHLGVDLRRLRYRPRRRAAGAPARVLMVGRFIEKKGFPDAVRALGLAARRVPLQATLVGDAGGGDRSDEEKAAILQAWRESGLGDRLRFAGFVSPRRLRAAARRHDIVLAPSRTAADGDSEGGCPMAIPELGATGLAVVATTHADIPMLVRHQETGLSCEPGDVEALADLLVEAASDPAGAARRSRAFRQLIEQDFDARRQGGRLADVYREVAGGIR